MFGVELRVEQTRSIGPLALRALTRAARASCARAKTETSCPALRARGARINHHDAAAAAAEQVKIKGHDGNAAATGFMCRYRSGAAFVGSYLLAPAGGDVEAGGHAVSRRRPAHSLVRSLPRYSLMTIGHGRWRVFYGLALCRCQRRLARLITPTTYNYR